MSPLPLEYLQHILDETEYLRSKTAGLGLERRRSLVLSFVS